MGDRGISYEQFAAGGLMIISALIFTAGGILYTGRAILKWPAAGTDIYLRVERGLVIAALLTMTVGFVLFERLLEGAGDRIFAPAGMAIILVGSAVATLAETVFISRNEWIYSSIVVFVILAFVSQAVFGLALLRTGLLPGWVGWATILWNLVWMVVLPIARPKDMYYPWLHYAAPLLIGIRLLLKG